MSAIDRINTREGELSGGVAVRARERHARTVRVGPYEIEREVGRGGMAVVYLGRSPAGATVAVKVLASAAPDALARFERERRLLASLGDTEGFVPVLDAGTSGGRPWIAMPYLT